MISKLLDFVIVWTIVWGALVLIFRMVDKKDKPKE